MDNTVSYAIEDYCLHHVQEAMACCNRRNHRDGPLRYEIHSFLADIDDKHQVIKCALEVATIKFKAMCYGLNGHARVHLPVSARDAGRKKKRARNHP